jgi:hypothetical protein
MLRRSFVFSLLVLAACSSDPSVVPGADAGGDGSTADVSVSDANTDGAPNDAGPGDASIDDILGTFGQGSTCPLVNADLGSPNPSLRQDSLVFTSSEKWERAALSSGGQTMWDIPNAGGSSIESEIMSFEILHFCEGAKLLKTETEILYAPPDDSGPNTITDLEVEIAGKKVGVSVTRAYKPANQTLTDPEVQSLLEKKLDGVIRSSQRVLPADKWVKQILHVFVANKAARDAVVRVYENVITPQTKADTILLVTQTTGGGFIYCNPDPPLGSECP